MKRRKIDTDVFEFPDEDHWEDQWRDMPEFDQPENGAFRQIIVSFDDQEGVNKFANLIGQSLTEKTKSIWFPERERNNVVDLFWFDTNGKTDV